jgi:hypothetical protein
MHMLKGAIQTQTLANVEIGLPDPAVLYQTPLLCFTSAYNIRLPHFSLNPPARRNRF